jgi:phosphate transport system permease protein
MTNAAKHLKKRHRKEKIFRCCGFLSIVFATTMLALLLFDLGSKAIPAFRQSMLTLDVYYDRNNLDVLSQTSIRSGNFRGLVRDALFSKFPDITERGEKRELTALLSASAEDILRQRVIKNPALVGQRETLRVPLSDTADQYLKHQNIKTTLSPLQISALEDLRAKGLISRPFNITFFTVADSRQPESAGILGALVGTIMTLSITILLAFPLGIMAAIYLEEFAGNSRLRNVIEININNLAAVPSIIYGLLGLSVFLVFFQWPRSSPLVGGAVLALLTLPTAIIATRAALQSVPDSIRQAAQGLGASPVQVVFDHVVPCAMPGILTGMILGVARAVGETAPLLLIGMVAFISDVPRSLTDSATVLPVQIFLWSSNPDIGYQEKTAAAIIILMVFLLSMNAAAIYLRKKLEKKW